MCGLSPLKLKMKSVKQVAQSLHHLNNSIPYAYTHSTNDLTVFASEPQQEEEGLIPTVDFGLLTSASPDQRSQAVHELSRACEEWGLFLVLNHGVEENLMKKMVDVCSEFFDMREEEKREFEGKHVLDPIRYGTSFNATKEKVFFWRDFLKLFVHPHFHSPNKPFGFSEVCLEYCKRVREVAKELLKGISESLGLEEVHMCKALDLESSFQAFAANLYPPCPQPELAMGLPPHSDHGLLTLLIQNGIGGLQIQHNGKWLNVNALPNSFLVIVGDHLQIFSNGKYKSVLHRAVVKSETTRISIAVTNGPSLETVVGPASELVEDGKHEPAYIPMKYKDYLELQQSNPLDGKTCLDRVRV